MENARGGRALTHVRARHALLLRARSFLQDIAMRILLDPLDVAEQRA